MSLDATDTVPAHEQTVTVAPRGAAITIARLYHLALALVGTAVLLIYVWAPATYEGNFGAVNGVVFTYSYFTVWSNLFNTIVLWSLVANPARDGGVFRWLRMTALVMITVTGLIYFLVLAATANPQGVYVYTNIGAHYIGPWGTVLGFVLFGPRPRFTLRHVVLLLIIPMIWLAYTLTHGLFLTVPPADTPGVVPGEAINFYPYPFIDPADPAPLIPGLESAGYAGVAINIAAILALGIGLGFVYLGLDRLLSRGRKPASGSG
jgi:hypothetical protein